MEKLEQSEKVIALGKLLVKELGLEGGVDTLARWMSHYLAERIVYAENLEESVEKTEAEKECCELILKIWSHRSHMPYGMRPFKSFEPIVKVLESLSPDNVEPFLHRISELELKRLKDEYPNYKDIEPYIESVIEIEKLTRIWMESLLNRAALQVHDENTKAWLHTASQVSLSDDIVSVNMMLENFNLLDEAEEKSSHDITRLQMRVQQLKKFGDLNQFLLKIYQDELADRDDT